MFRGIRPNTLFVDSDLNSHVDTKHPLNEGRALTAAEDISLPDQPSTSKERGENKDPSTDVETVCSQRHRPGNHYTTKNGAETKSNRFSQSIKKLHNIKFYLNIRVRMVRQMGNEEEFIVPHFRSRTFDEEHDLNTAFQQMQNALEEFVHRGSNWRMEFVTGIEIRIVPYQPLSAAKYSPLPSRVQPLKGIINLTS